MGPPYRPGSEGVAVCGWLLHEVSDLPESAVPSEVERSLAVGAARRLAALPGRAAVARSAWDPARRPRQVRRILEAGSGVGKSAIGCREGSAVQAISGL